MFGEKCYFFVMVNEQVLKIIVYVFIFNYYLYVKLMLVFIYNGYWYGMDMFVYVFNFQFWVVDIGFQYVKCFCDIM